MADTFEGMATGISGPPENGAEVGPDDATDLSYVTRAIYVGGAGDLAVRLKDGTDLTFEGLGAGSLLPIRAARVLATGTTATGIVALW